jgi:hypothetical protein
VTDTLPYTLADDLLAKKQAEIREVDADGVVSDLVFDNQSDKHALLLDGIELRGCKQNRMVNTTILATAGEQTTVDVSCVEAGRWHHQGETFAHSGRTVGAALRNHKAHMVHGRPGQNSASENPDTEPESRGSGSLRTEPMLEDPSEEILSPLENTEAEDLARRLARRHGRRPGAGNEQFSHQERGRARTDQSAVWNHVDDYLRENASPSATSALDDAYQSSVRGDAGGAKRAAAQKTIETRLHETHATGAIVALGDRIIGLDLFGDRDTFGGFWKSVADGYALDARSHARNQGIRHEDRKAEGEAPFSEPKVSREQVEAWTSFLQTGVELAPRELAGVGEHFSVQGPGVAGGLVLLEGELVHAALFPALG